MSRREKIITCKNLRPGLLQEINPKTPAQKETFQAFDDEKNLMLHGYAGTGKTFIMLYLALNAILNRTVPQEKILIVRSMLPIRDIGFLPGNTEEKTSVYTEPYNALFEELFPGIPNPYDLAKYSDILDFMPTSYMRGITVRDSLVIVDECQNLNFHELDTIMTRVGQNSKIYFCGDFLQTDLRNPQEQNGIIKFMDILHDMKSFRTIAFKEHDIVRSGLVKEYIISKNKKEYAMNFDSIDKKLRSKIA